MAPGHTLQPVERSSCRMVIIGAPSGSYSSGPANFPRRETCSIPKPLGAFCAEIVSYAQKDVGDNNI